MRANLRRYLRSAHQTLRQDWGLIIVALLVATVFWWEVDENRNVSRYFPDVEVRFVNLDPAMILARDQKPLKVGVRVSGPRLLQDLDGVDFVMRVDLSDIRDATAHQIILNPKGFAPIVPGLSSDDIRVRQVDIIPSRIMVITEWNSRVARVVPRYSPKPALGYVISATWVSPATITLAGSDSDLARHAIVRNKNELVLEGETETKEQVWTTEDLDIGNLKVLDEPKPVIRFKIFVEPFFRKRLVSKVPIRIAGKIPGSTETAGTVSIEPTNVDILIQGARLKVNSVAPDSVALELDIARLPPGEHKVPVVHLNPVNLPSDVQIIEATPTALTVWVQGPHELETVFQELWKGVRESYLSGNLPESVTEVLSLTPTSVTTPLPTQMEEKP